MGCRILIHISVILLANITFLSAQRVMYCTPVDTRYSIRWEVAGKAGDYYWIEITSRQRETKHHTGPAIEQRVFDIYDTRMNPVNTVPSYPVSDTTLKEYFVPGARYFDQVILLAGHKKTIALVQRYEPQGSATANVEEIAEFPFSEPGNSFLLVRSEDRSRILLLGFESMPSSAPRLHAILFDQDWQELSARTYVHPGISQPVIQDDFTGYPLEDFNKGPVKLANNGEWLMASPSRNNRNFLLFHFCDTDRALSCKEIELPPTSTVEDMDLSVDNERGEAFAGILSTLDYDVVKHVRVAHYSMAGRDFDFDSSYQVSTLVTGKTKDEFQIKENFIAVPGKGFMLLKEYGRPFEDGYNGDMGYRGWDPAFMLTNNIIPDSGSIFPVVVRDGYARYGLLGPMVNTHVRGDLGLYFFPAGKRDSCWSGMLSKEQVTEMNAPNLSYLMMPVRDRLVFLYNSFIRNDNQYATTTILDPRGELMAEDGVIFWNIRKGLDFQQARQISASEVIVPYALMERKGFADIRF
jgi:hypothetical protein